MGGLPATTGTAANTGGGQEIEWLMIAWADVFEDIRCTDDGRYQGRCQSGDGETVTVGSPWHWSAFGEHWDNTCRTERA
jgi:hypothetical protein